MANDPLMNGTRHNQTEFDNELFRKITYRVIPVLWLAYIINYLDRTNIAFAKLQMQEQLGFSNAVFGLGASMVFVGLILFEIPSNLILARIGMRKTLIRIMVLWGLCSASMAFVTTPMQFYILRFFLGVFEAGLSPGGLYFITLWYPAARRAHANSLLITAPSIAALLSGPLAAGFITYFDGIAGLHGWQWLFIMEGLPCVLLAVVVYKVLSNCPDEAGWLTTNQRARVSNLLRQDRLETPNHSLNKREVARILGNPLFWALSSVGFLLLIALFGLTFWQPTLLKGLGLSNMQVGLYSVFPALSGAIGAIVIGKHSDRTGERCRHFIACALTASVGLLLTAVSGGSFLGVMFSLCVAWAGMSSAFSLVWAFPARIFSGSLAAAGFALLTVVTGGAGIVAPYSIGLLKTATGGFSVTLYLMSALVALATLIFYWFFCKVRHERTAILS